MARLLDRRVLHTTMDHRLLGLEDRSCQGDAPDPPRPGEWCSATQDAVLFSIEDDVIDLELRLELWDAAPECDAADWQRVATFRMDFPTGELVQNCVAAGGAPAIELPHGGDWNLTAAWAFDGYYDRDTGSSNSGPEARLLVRFWS